MRKDPNLMDAIDTTVSEVDAANLGPDAKAYLEAKGMQPEELQRMFEQMQAALEALPDSMDGMMMGFFISRMLDAFEIEGSTRLELLLNVAANTDGVQARVQRLRATEGEDGEMEFEEVECGCPKCVARREAEAVRH